MTTLLDGKKVASQVSSHLKEQVTKLNKEKIFPTLCVIEVGDDPASKIYLRVKKKLAQKLGIREHFLHFPADISEEELLKEIKKLNEDPEINGIMVQLPIPNHLNQDTILESIDPKKDVDGFHPYNQGKLWQGSGDIIPATVRSILTLIEHYNLDVAGKNALVIGRSVIVGKPIAAELLNMDATVTIAHSKTEGLNELVKQADILISDVGKAHLITGDMIKPGAIIIDVGMNRENGHLMGDVEFDECFPIASAITPVPGGVGPLTVASLMKQVIILTEKQNNG